MPRSRPIQKPSPLTSLIEPSHYDLGPLRNRLPEPKSQEDALVTVYSILQSAAATAYEHADNQTGSNRKVAMGVVHLIEMAQMWMDSLLDKPTARTDS
ncbi:DUF6124 family protein [Pseudomonas asplenii]|uniref:DUF6124 family protein n=1 Tax=Pseudomonas asplenii TaxID=53407 RepID=UPI003B28725C